MSEKQLHQRIKETQKNVNKNWKSTKNKMKNKKETDLGQSTQTTRNLARSLQQLKEERVCTSRYICMCTCVCV